MKKRFRDYIIFSATVALLLLVTGGLFAGEKAADKEAKIDLQLPASVDELSVMEVELKAKSREISDQLFKVLSDMRLEKSKVTKSDPEIRALNVKIAKLRTEVEKLTLAKSKEIVQWSKKRDELMAQDANLRKELIAVKSKKTTLLKNDKSKTDVNK